MEFAFLAKILFLTEIFLSGQNFPYGLPLRRMENFYDKYVNFVTIKLPFQAVSYQLQLNFFILNISLLKPFPSLKTISLKHTPHKRLTSKNRSLVNQHSNEPVKQPNILLNHEKLHPVIYDIIIYKFINI